MDTDRGARVKVHLVDGTYELFRHYFGLPPHANRDGSEVGAARGVLASVLSMLESGATHLGVATDHVVESFRNAMWPGYKTAEGVPPALLAQFDLLEEVLRALGVAVWAMVDLEADDALASAAGTAACDPSVSQVLVCTPDKDLAQCVSGTRVVQLDRRRNLLVDEEAVRAKFGVGPRSIPDYLALVGDSADGFPGLAGWGPKSAAAVLARFEHLEAVPADAGEWGVRLRGAGTLAATLRSGWDRALLFRDLATLRVAPPVLSSVDALRWNGPEAGLGQLCERVLDAPDLSARALALSSRRRRAAGGG